jgi:flagellum-specific peptidoglycan hydrolase FlgJ
VEKYRFSNVFWNWRCKSYLLIVILFGLLLFGSPASAAVESIVAADRNGDRHQYAYDALLSSYALKMLGKTDGLYEDFAAKRPVALLDSENGYIDYNDVLSQYAMTLLSGQTFDLNHYASGSAVQKAKMPASIKLVSLSSGKLTRSTFNIGQGDGSELDSPQPKDNQPTPLKTLAKEDQPKEDPVSEPEAKPVTITPIVEPTAVTLARAQQWASLNGAHQSFIDAAPLYWQYGQLSGIRPEVLYAQAALETGFGRYGGNVPPEFNNWAGIKIATSNGNKPEDHEQFATPEDGVRGHFNHMSAYVGLEPIGVPHGRYYVVARISWAGSVKTVEDLSGKWAPSPTYHERIVAMIEAMQ